MILFALVVSPFLGQVLGLPIAEGEFNKVQYLPWLVSIQKNGYHHCVGSIISRRIVLTASHCTDNHSPDWFLVRAGSSKTDSGGSWHSVVKIIQHEKYEKLPAFPPYKKDLALIKVAPAFDFSRSLSKIHLAHAKHIIPSDSLVNIAGWGATTDGGYPIHDMKSTFLRIVDIEKCANAYGNKTRQEMTLDNQICTIPVDGDACSGDSGGPLVDRNLIQIGVISWGLFCSRTNFPRIHQNIAYYRDWIEMNSYELDPSADLQ